MADIKVGDNVSWNSAGGPSDGTVTKKITKDGTIAGHSYNASSDNPQFEVESSKSGKKAVHKPGSLDKN